MTRSLLPVALAVFAWSCTVTSLSAEDGKITLDEISRRLGEWRSSFVNIRVVWEARALPETNDAIGEWPPPPPEAETEPPFLRTEWIWADHGLDLLEDRRYSYENGSAQSDGHSTEVFNGPKGIVFRARFRKPAENEPEKLAQLELLGLGTGKPISALARTPMNGLYWPGTVQWLPSILSEWKWKLEEVESVGGEPCARIVATQPYVTDVSFEETIWLDLNHDCLVRRWRSPAVPKRRAGRDFIIDEFQQTDGIWLPKRGRLQLGGLGSDGQPSRNRNQMFAVIEAAVNVSPDLGRFDPPTPIVGTVVLDHGRSYTYGASKGPLPGAKMNGTAEQSSGVGTSIHPSAVLPRPSWLWWSGGLASIAVILLVVGFWLAHRKKEA
jgi:hypothetical protein